MLAKTLIDTDQVSRADLEQNAGYHETRILEKVLSNPDVMPAEDYKKLRRYSAEDEEKSKVGETVPTRLKYSIHTANYRLFSRAATRCGQKQRWSQTPDMNGISIMIKEL